MKRAIFTLVWAVLATGLSAGYALASDLIVEQNGVLPNYGTIQDAVNAAVDGDRIFVKNKAGNVPYQENVTINVSCELLPFDANGQFIVLGNYTINPIIGRTVTIIGMYNQVGSISCTANSPAGTPTRINILGNELLSGTINLSGTNIVSHVSGNRLSGAITTRYATITGNHITSSGGITLNDAANLTSEDTLYIVGNRLTTGRITWSNDEHYFHIANNLTNSNTYGVYVTQLKGGNGINHIDNNTLRPAASNARAIYVTNVPANTGLEINNNVLVNTTTSGTSYPIYVTGINATATVGYFFNRRQGWDGGIICTGCGNTDNTVVTLTVDYSTGVCSSVPACVDAGNPGTDFTDHDLTRNDIGTAGGSFNQTNFFPLLTGGARVYMVKTPRTVLQTSTIRAEADSYDR